MKELIAKAKEEFRKEAVKVGTWQRRFEDEFCIDGGVFWHRHMADSDDEEQIFSLQQFIEQELQEAYSAGQESMLLEEKPIPDKTSGKMWLLYETGYNQACKELRAKLTD